MQIVNSWLTDAFRIRSHWGMAVETHKPCARRRRSSSSLAASPRVRRKRVVTLCKSAKVVEDGEEEDKQDKNNGTVGGKEGEEESGADAPRRRRGRRAESTDAIATWATRRFGIAGGLAWVGILAFGVISEQVKTRLEVASEGANTRVASGDETQWVALSEGEEGLRYQDIRVGGGSLPRNGDIVALHFIGTEAGAEKPWYNTYAEGKPIVFLYGSRPFAGGMCAGVEMALASMRAGGKRIIEVPSQLGFGERGLQLRGTRHVSEKDARVEPGSDLRYEIELVKVSIAPS